MENCIILNGDYTYLNVVNWQRALTLQFKGDTEVLKYSNQVAHSAGGKVFRIPLVMKLLKIIRMIYKNKVPFSKRNVRVRDGFACMYCGASDKIRLEIDHIIPVSRGGKSTFENCVASCKACNHKKSNRTPTEAKMYLRKQPHNPTISEFIMMQMKQLKLDTILKELGVY